MTLKRAHYIMMTRTRHKYQ